MTTPRSPEGEMVDIMDLDREIEALRCGLGSSADEGLAVLLDLRDEVDLRAADLLGERDVIRQLPAKRPPATTTRRRRHRLAVIPAAAALVLASTGAAAAFSGSPHAPFYPLHRLIFGPAPGSDRQLGRDLAEAQILLNRAAGQPYSARAGALAQARLVLAQAQSLLPMAKARTQFSLELAAALARLRALETPPTTGKLGPLPSAPATLAPDPPEPSEATASPESANGEGESSGLAPGVAESETASISPAGNEPTGESPEAVKSPATQTVRGQNDDPARSGSPSSRTESADN